MKVVEVDLPDKGGVVFMFEIFGEYLFGELPDILDGKGPFMLIVEYDVLILLVLRWK